MIYGSTKKIIVTHLIAWCTIEVDVDVDDVELYWMTWKMIELTEPMTLSEEEFARIEAYSWIWLEFSYRAQNGLAEFLMLLSCILKNNIWYNTCNVIIKIKLN